MSTPLEFAAACSPRFGAAYKASQVAALKVATEATKKGIAFSYQRSGWNPKKSGMGPLGFTSRILGHEAAMVTAKGGAAYAFEYGAGKYGPKHSPWLIFPSGTHLRRGTRRSKQLSTGATALRTPYGPKAWVKHEGYKGRPFWDHGLLEAEPAVIKAMEAAVVNTLRRTFT